MTMRHRINTVLTLAAVAMAILVLTATSARAAIIVDGTQQFTLQGGNGLKAVNSLGAFDAAGADKLVVVVSTEHGFNTTHNGNVHDIQYNGVSLTQAVEQRGISDATAEIWYLDNPGAIGVGTIEISAANPNGGMGAVYALSNTLAGIGATSASITPSVSITTTAADSLIRW